MSQLAITADDLCGAVEQTLRAHLEGVIALLGFESLAPVRTWGQVPTMQALTTALLPGVAITSGGMIEATRTASGGYDAVFGVAVGAWERGADFNETARRARLRGAAIRATLLAHPTLGGIAESIRWDSETYDEIDDRTSARTLGGTVVGFRVTIRNAIDPRGIRAGTLTGPAVTTTTTTVTKS